LVSVIVRGLSECERNLRAAQKETGNAQRRMLIAGGAHVLRALKLRMGKRGPSDPFWGRTSPGEGMLGQRTGGTTNRLQGGTVMGAGNALWMAVGSPDKYVKNAELGGTYTTSGFFRIPTAAAQTASGADRLMGQSIKGRAGYALIRSKAGKLWGVFMQARKWTLMYLFVKKITLKGHHVFTRTRADAEPKVAGIARLEVQSVVRVGNG
jgi:hypothetical protein